MEVEVAAEGRLILLRPARDAMGPSGDTEATPTIEGDVVRQTPLGHRVRRARELLLDGATAEAARPVLDEPALALHRHEEAAARAPAAPGPQTRRHGRSLGERPRMAMGPALGLPVLTADRQRKDVRFEGLAVEMVPRPSARPAAGIIPTAPASDSKAAACHSLM